MYLMITEDWNVYKSEIITDGDAQAASDGYLDVIDISDPKNPKRFDGENYHDIDVWPTGEQDCEE